MTTVVNLKILYNMFSTSLIVRFYHSNSNSLHFQYISQKLTKIDIAQMFPQARKLFRHPFPIGHKDSLFIAPKNLTLFAHP